MAERGLDVPSNNINFDKVCRTCLSERNDLKSIFLSDDACKGCNYGTMVSECTKLQLSQNDGLPSTICEKCVHDITSAFEFKKRAEKCDILLRGFFNQKQLHENDIKEEVSTEAEAEIKVELLNIDTKQNLSDQDDEGMFDRDDENFIKNGDFSDDDVKPLKDLQNTILKKVAQNEQDSDVAFKCQYCTRSFSKEYHLKRHKCLGYSSDSSMLNGNNTFAGFGQWKCKSCNEKFEHCNQLDEHLKEHLSSKIPKKRGRPSRKDYEAKLQLKSILDKMTVQEIKSLDEELDQDYFPETSEVGTMAKYFCSVCNKTFLSRSYFQQHMRKHNDRKIFECKICERSYLRVDLLKKHLHSHIALEELSAIDFKSKLKLFENHEKYKELDPVTETNERLCEIVVEDIQEDRLHRYMLNVEDDDNRASPTCETCGISFPYEMALNKHILRSHRGQKVSVKFLDPDYQKREKKYQCQNCNKTFYRAAHLIKHGRTHVPTEKKFECTLCKKKFNRKDNLRSHMRVHEPNKEDLESNCLCVYCGRSFSNSSNLIVHMRRHTGEKPYKCDICEKGFPRSSDLQCHRRTHTGEKPCLCTICGKGFSRSNKLVRHMRIHTGQRPYKCTFCDRAFTQSNDLTLHIRRHTGDKPYVCNICGDRFIQGTALQTHRRLLNHHEPPQPPQPPVNSVNNPHRPAQRNKSTKHINVTATDNRRTDTKCDSSSLKNSGGNVDGVTSRTSAGANGGSAYLTTTSVIDVSSIADHALFSIGQYNQSFN